MRLSHHSIESWNPDKLLVSQKLLDSIFRWNDEVWGICTIIGQTEECPPLFPPLLKGEHKGDFQSCYLPGILKIHPAPLYERGEERLLQEIITWLKPSNLQNDVSNPT